MGIIKQTFDKYNEYEDFIERNDCIGKQYQKELEKKTIASRKDPFTYLQEVNNIDILKKKINVLKNNNQNMRRELEDIPNVIRKQINSAVLSYFKQNEETKKQRELQIKLQKEKHDTIIKYAKLSFGLGVVSIVSVLVTKLIRSRK